MFISYFTHLFRSNFVFKSCTLMFINYFIHVFIHVKTNSMQYVNLTYRQIPYPKDMYQYGSMNANKWEWEYYKPSSFAHLQVAVSLMFSIIIVSTIMYHNTGPSLINRHACVRAQTNTHKTASVHQSQSEATKTSHNMECNSIPLITIF